MADLSKDQSDKAAEFVPGRGWLRLHPLAETEHANPAYPALPALHAADSATATGGASAADHDEDREPNRKAGAHEKEFAPVLDSHRSSSAL